MKIYRDNKNCILIIWIRVGTNRACMCILYTYVYIFGLEMHSVSAQNKE